MLICLGVDHKSAPLSSLDAVTLRDQRRFYRILSSISGIKGSIILQTCNRVEFYLDSESSSVVDDVFWHWALETRFKLGELKRLTWRVEEADVVDHLVRVGSGLESMLLGENQILGQVKGALAESLSAKATTPLLHKLFDKSVSAAATIRDETGFGKGTVSLGSTALRLVEEKVGEINAWKVLLVGAGEVGLLMMKALRARGISQVEVASRTIERARSFTQTHGGKPISLEDARKQLSRFDLVVTATKAANYLLTKETLASALEEQGKPRMLLDLSNPRNISPDVAELKGVILNTIDDLRNIANEALAQRKRAAKAAEAMVAQHVEGIIGTIRRKKADPIVSEVYKRADEIRAEELNHVLPKLKLTPEQEGILKNMSQSMVEKLLGPPMTNLRKAAERGDAETLAAAETLFSGE